MLNPIFAQTNGFAEYADSAHKLLSCNREFYIAQSRLTVNGRVPTADEVRASFNPRRQSEAAAARGALADGDFYDPDPPTPEEVAEAYELKYGRVAVAE